MEASLVKKKKSVKCPVFIIRYIVCIYDKNHVSMNCIIVGERCIKYKPRVH